MTTKLIIFSIAGISTLGGASIGCYYCFKSKAPESTKSLNKNNTQNTEAQTSKTERVDTSAVSQGTLPPVTTGTSTPREGQDPTITQSTLQGSPAGGSASGEAGPIDPAGGVG